MICPKCGKESVKDALYCEWCGTSLEAENRNKIYLIYNSKKKYKFFTLITLALVFGGVFILSNSNEELEEYSIKGSGRFLSGHPDGLRLVGVFLLIFSISILILYLYEYKVQTKNPILKLDYEGIESYFRSNGFKGKIGWNEITNIYLKEVNGVRYLVIEFETKNETYEALRKYGLFDHNSIKRRDFKITSLSMEIVDMSDEEIMEVIHEFQQKYENKTLSQSAENIS